MTVITRQRTDKFALIPNSVAEDERVSFEARGMLLYLLAKPNDWRVSIGDLQRAGRTGRDRTYRIIKELVDAGYITRRVTRDASGVIREQEYVVYDDPVPDQLPFPENPEVGKPLPEKPDTAQPDTAEPDAVSPDAGFQDGLLRPKVPKPKVPIPSLTNTQPAGGKFDEIWKAWPPDHRPNNRGLAESLFDRLPAPIDQQNAVAMAEAYHRLMARRGKRAALITYLKERCWRWLVDAPPTDRDGEFIITPDRPEWQPWLDQLREKFGETAVQSAQRTRKIVRAERWPGSNLAAHGGQIGMQLGRPQ